MKSENKYFEDVPIELCQSKGTIMYQSPSAVSPFLCHLTKNIVMVLTFQPISLFYAFSSY